MAALPQPPSTFLPLPLSALREAKGGAQQAGGDRDYGPDQGQHSVDCDAYDAERQEQQPDDWVEHQREQGQRPEQHKQNAPEKEGGHGSSPDFRYARGGAGV